MRVHYYNPRRLSHIQFDPSARRRVFRVFTRVRESFREQARNIVLNLKYSMH